MFDPLSILEQGYRFGVTATNVVGTSAESTLTDPVVTGFARDSPPTTRPARPGRPNSCPAAPRRHRARGPGGLVDRVRRLHLRTPYVPQGRIRVDNPNLYDVALRGVVADVDVATAGDPSTTIGFTNAVLQRTIQIMSTSAGKATSVPHRPDQRERRLRGQLGGQLVGDPVAAGSARRVAGCPRDRRTAPAEHPARHGRPAVGTLPVDPRRSVRPEQIMRIITRQGHPDFLDLPWGTPLEEWDHPRMEKMAHGMSRHVVRFVRFDERVYALKETDARLAQRELDILKDLRDDHLPVVEPVGVVLDTPSPQGGVLITRYLDYSLPYWYVFGQTDPTQADRLIDAGVVLLVRLHLEGVFWGDCSLSNILWRRDAGAMMAYLVDAETSERHPSISDQMRAYDIDIAVENMVGGLLELQAQGRVTEKFDPIEAAETLRERYEELWSELTRTDDFGIDERWRIDQRIRRINELGFDVEELSISKDGETLSIKPVLIDEGHHARELRRRTGLEVQENQARRLLADIGNFRAWLERDTGRSIPESVATARWLADVYEPLIELVPDEVGAQLEPAELFHHVLENRYYMAERRGGEVTNAEALDDLLHGILQHRPAERQLSLEFDDSALDS